MPDATSGDDGGSNGDGNGGPTEPPTFQIVSPNLDVRPGADVTFCFYFQTSNTSDLSIKRWVSRMSPGVRQTILYLTSSSLQPPGSMVSTSAMCGLESLGGKPPAWIYSARTPDAEAVMPSDDGEGHPVGYTIRAGQAGFLEMHYINDTNATIHPHVEIDAYAYPEGIQVTPAGTFTAYNRMMLKSPGIQPGSVTNPTKTSVVDSCPVRADRGKAPKFFAMTTLTFKRGVHTWVKDGDKTIFEATNWAQPGSATWSSPPFYTFSSGMLTYQCDYLNPTLDTITLGDDPAKNENCRAVGYYFPLVSDDANNPSNGHFCFDSAIFY